VGGSNIMVVRIRMVGIGRIGAKCGNKKWKKKLHN
jgi:hypothetical protein